MPPRVKAGILGGILAAIPLAMAVALFPSGGGTIVIVLAPFAIPGLLLVAWALRPR